VDGIIFKIIIEGTFAKAIVLIGVLNDWLLEVYSEVKYLTVVLKPFRCDSWDRVVLLLRALDTSKCGAAA